MRTYAHIRNVHNVCEESFKILLKARKQVCKREAFLLAHRTGHGGISIHKEVSSPECVTCI